MFYLKNSKSATFILLGICLTMYLVYFLSNFYFESMFYPHHSLKLKNVVYVKEAPTTENEVNVKTKIAVTSAINDPLYCYQMKVSDNLPEIATTGPLPRNDSIFFLETTCKSFNNGKITIQMRHACSVESVAYTNPKTSVYLLYVSPGSLKLQETESDRLLEVLLSYDNIYLRYINFDEYVRGSPVENVFVTLRTSKYAQSHSSDMLRFLTLWKFGGFYLDLDVVVFKPLVNLASTFAGAESASDVRSAILRFDSAGLGHEKAEACLNNFAHNYRPNEWSYNGPGVLTRLVWKLCGVKTVKEAFNRTCDGFTLYPPSYFYPLYYPKWSYYFEEKFVTGVMRETKNSYAVHVWNKLSAANKMSCRANVAYVKYAQKYCPKVYQICKDYF